MTLGKITILGLLLWLLLLSEKFLFFGAIATAGVWKLWAYYLIIIIICRVLARRLGILNFLEAFFVATIWLLIVLLFDYWVGKRLLGNFVFQDKHYWYGYIAAFVSVFFLHKKRHIQIRKEQAARHN